MVYQENFGELFKLAMCSSHPPMRTGSASGDAEYTSPIGEGNGLRIRGYLVHRCHLVKGMGSASGDAEYTGGAHWEVLSSLRRG